MRYTFNEYFELVQEAAGQRVDKDAVRYFYDQGAAYLDCVVRLTYRQK